MPSPAGGVHLELFALWTLVNVKSPGKPTEIAIHVHRL